MSLPIIHVEAETIAEAWEQSLVSLWNGGADIKTEYDSPKDPPSRDATMIMVVRNPFAEPRIHLGFPGGMEDLEKYRQEVVDGIHDGWINPAEGKWTYTYHDRLFNYHLPGESKTVDQMACLVDKLSDAPHTRRAQAITWIPACDPGTYDPPCLQRVWCRVYEEEGSFLLAMNTHWRSRDAYRAAYMNLFGITELQKTLAERISAKTGKKIGVGRYVDIADSYHIYGESFADFQERFLSSMEKRSFHDPDRTKSRTMRSDDPAVQEGFAYGRILLEKERSSGVKGATV